MTITTPTRARDPRAPRRTLYRRLKRVLLNGATSHWRVSRLALEATIRRALRPLSRPAIVFLLRDRRAALAAVGALLTTIAAPASPPVELADIAAGDGGFVINGTDDDEHSVITVSGAGDVNGDGLSDIIMGVVRANGFAGASYVIFGKAGTAPVSLSDVAASTGGFVILGINPGDASGRSVSGAGDVNGDGLADVIVGAPSADPHGNTGAGESYVVFGTSDTRPVDLAAVAAGKGGLVIRGADAGDGCGLSVSGAGDVNGDGLSDVVVGAVWASPGRRNGAGASYVVFGTADTTPIELADIAAGCGGFVMNGIDAFDSSGWSVSGAGDVNGDGLADVLVGALQADPGGMSRAGESYVVFGMADTTPIELADIAAGRGGFIMNGIAADDRSGWSVSGAGDVNGDGLADVLVGAPYADHQGSSRVGMSFLVFGKADMTPVELADVASGLGGFVLIGIDTNDISGFSVSDAGDVNGDGLADVIVGAPNAAPGGNSSAGESAVVFGKTDTAPVMLSDIAAGVGGFVINGVEVLDNAGVSVSAAGDVNGDGMPDLVVGAHQPDPGAYAQPGKSYLIFNSVDAPCPADLSNDDDVGPGDLAILLANWGPCRACAADLNGDGAVDPEDLAALLAAWGACP